MSGASNTPTERIWAFFAVHEDGRITTVHVSRDGYPKVGLAMGEAMKQLGEGWRIVYEVPA